MSTALVRIEDRMVEQVRGLIALRDMAVANADDAKSATDARTCIKATQNVLEKQRKSLVDPLNKQVKEINAAFKEWSEPLATTDAELERKMLAWHRAERERVEAERRRVEEENARRREEAAAEEARRITAAAEEARALAEDLGVDECDIAEAEEAAANAVPEVQPVLEVAPVIEMAVRGDLGTSQIRKTWTFDLEDLSAVPREFLVLDERAVRVAIRDGVREIPGLRIYQTESLARR